MRKSRAVSIFIIGAGFVAAATVYKINSANPTESGRSAAAQKVVQSTPQQLSKAKQCQALLKKDKSGLWRRYQTSATDMTVTVGPSFFTSDYETKSTLNAIMRCVGTEGRMDESISFIDYVDWRTHNEVAVWSPDLGLQIKD